MRSVMRPRCLFLREHCSRLHAKSQNNHAQNHLAPRDDKTPTQYYGEELTQR